MQRVHEVLPSSVLILHLSFILPLSLSFFFFFTITQKFTLTYITVISLMSH